ncbi:hypothetical protein LCGC14_1417250 [marine sediment metagenome]|uniref:Uncharacterized protein n=1 Tax=marine sediment metagenome TaxID=412755 RepID=A0A0F9MU28_9ZZZZ
MDRRELVKMLPVLMLGGKIPENLSATETDDPIHVPDNTAVSAVRYNGKSYALGFPISKHDPTKAAKQIAMLNHCMERTIMEITKFK